MKYDGILFDLDGTLWNATKSIGESWKLALKSEPDVRRPPTIKELEGVMGMTPEDLTRTLFPYLSSQRRMELFEHCCQVENDYLCQHGGVLYPGIEEMLAALSRLAPLFIVSNCNTGYIPAFLQAHKLEKYFKDWECFGGTGLLKWENIKLMVKRHQLQSPVYVGDTDIDQGSARQAGVPFVHAGYGFGQAPGAVSAGSPAQLLELLQNS